MWPLAKCISSVLVRTPSLQLGALQLLRYVSPSLSKAAQVEHKGVNPFTQCV